MQMSIAGWGNTPSVVGEGSGVPLSTECDSHHGLGRWVSICVVVYTGVLGQHAARGRRGALRPALHECDPHGYCTVLARLLSWHWDSHGYRTVLARLLSRHWGGRTTGAARCLRAARGVAFPSPFNVIRSGKKYGSSRFSGGWTRFGSPWYGGGLFRYACIVVSFCDAARFLAWWGCGTVV